MDDITSRVLATRTEGLTRTARWQQRKSAQTGSPSGGDRLPEHHGYGAPHQLIAEIAGISRGAMLHHYATKQELIASVIDFTVYKRMRFPGQHPFAVGSRAVDEMGVEVYWQSLLTREFSAYLELLIARAPIRNWRDLPAKARRYYRVDCGSRSRLSGMGEQAGGYAMAMDYCCSIQGLASCEIWEGQDRKRCCAVSSRHHGHAALGALTGRPERDTPSPRNRCLGRKGGRPTAWPPPERVDLGGLFEIAACGRVAIQAI